MSDEGTRWFLIEADRKRERERWARAVQKRARRLARLEDRLKSKIRMIRGEWTVDEHGNPSRTVRGEE